MESVSLGQVLSILGEYPEDTELTFGSSTFSQRPLIFFRCKKRGPTHICVELNELVDDDAYIPKPEHELRKTVGDLIRSLSVFPEHYQISFGCTIDAAPLKFAGITSAVSINLIQDEPPSSGPHAGEF